jgi:hypothetical protein
MRAYGIQDCSRERQLCVFQAQLREAVVIVSGTAARGAVILAKIAVARGSCAFVIFSGTAARGSCAITFLPYSCEKPL